jgi:hypothetical protein
MEPTYTPHQFALDQRLMPWPEVAERWNAMSGERITHARVCQVAYAAQEKLKAELSDIAVDYYDNAPSCGGCDE